jgi:hypothetical protein
MSETRQETAKRFGNRAANAVGKFPGQVAGRRAHHHALLVEYLLFCLVVAIRAAADYAPADGGTSKGSSKPASGQLGPLPLFGAGTGLFFILSFPASRGGTAAAVANGLGGLAILTLLMRSGPELNTVAGWYESLAGQGGSSGISASPVITGGNPAPPPGQQTD